MEELCEHEHHEQHRHVFITCHEEYDTHHNVQDNDARQQVFLAEFLRQVGNQEETQSCEGAHQPVDAHEAFVAHVVDEEIQDDAVDNVHEEVQEENRQHLEQVTVHQQVAEHVLHRDFFTGRRLHAFPDRGGTEHHEGIAGDHDQDHRHEVAVSQGFLTEQTYQQRYQGAHHANSGKHTQVRGGHKAGPCLGVIGDDRRDRPERDVGDGIYRAPENVGDRRIQHLPLNRKIRREEAQNRGDHHEQRCKLQVAFELAGFCPSGVHEPGHHGVVDGIPYTGNQENRGSRQGRDPQDISVEEQDEAAQQAIGEALAEAVGEVAQVFPAADFARYIVCFHVFAFLLLFLYRVSATPLPGHALCESLTGDGCPIMKHRAARGMDRSIPVLWPTGTRIRSPYPQPS